MNLRESLREKIRGRDGGNKPVEPEGPTTCRSILQYSSLRDLYRDFGVEPPVDDKDFDRDVEERIANFYLQIINGDLE